LLRGVVSEQPVEDSDVPFSGRPIKIDAELVQKIVSNCYGIETSLLDTLETIEKAKR
jgi:hypothetical protein